MFKDLYEGADSFLVSSERVREKGEKKERGTDKQMKETDTELECQTREIGINSFILQI